MILYWPQILFSAWWQSKGMNEIYISTKSKLQKFWDLYFRNTFFPYFFLVFVPTYSCFMIGGLLAWSKSSCVWFIYYFHHYYVRELLLQHEFWLTGQLILKSHILLNYLSVFSLWLIYWWLHFKIKIKTINISRNGDEFTIVTIDACEFQQDLSRCYMLKRLAATCVHWRCETCFSRRCTV